MAHANNMISEDMATIYWSYVTQEIKIIREHFDAILEKEVDLQGAMYEFYAPSSKKLTDEIGQYENQVDRILNQTSTINEVSDENVGASAEAEKELSSFLQAMTEYKETQITQQQLLDEFQLNQQQIIQEGIILNDELVQKGMGDLNDESSEHYDHYTAFNRSLTTHISDVRDTITVNDREVNNWSRDIERVYERQDNHFERILLEFSEDYLNQSFEKNNKQLLEDFQDAMEEILEAGQPVGLIIKREPEDIDSISFWDLQTALSNLEIEITHLKRQLEPESEEEKEEYEQKWKPLFDNYETVLDELELVMANYDSYEEVFAEWKKYTEYLLTINSALSQKTEETKEQAIRTINNNHRIIERFYTQLDHEKYEDLIEELKQIDRVLKRRSIHDILDYQEEVIKHTTVLEQKMIVDRELVFEIIETNDHMNEQREQMMEWYNLNQTLEERIQALLGTGEDSEENPRENFTLLVQQAEKTLDQYDEDLLNSQSNRQELIDSLLDETAQILNKITEENLITFEWEESPALMQLDEKNPEQIHDSSKTSFERLSELVLSLHDSQENMVDSTVNLHEVVSDVQKHSDDLNSRWEQNVQTTELIKDDVYSVLSNTIVDGQFNPIVYNHLANPVNVDGQVQGQVKSKTKERVPPVILLIIILISGLLVGFVSNYYSAVSYYIQSGLFILLNLAVSLSISIYSVRLYELNDTQAIQWFIITLLMIMITANIVRGALFVHPFIGWLASISMIVFFVTPLVNIAVPEFDLNNPIANIYIGLQYNLRTPYVSAVVILTLLMLLISSFVYIYQIQKRKGRKENQDEKAVS